MFFKLLTVTFLSLTMTVPALKTPEGIIHQNVNNYSGTNFVVSTKDIIELKIKHQLIQVLPKSSSLVSVDKDSVVIYVFNGHVKFKSDYHFENDSNEITFLIDEGSMYSDGQIKPFDSERILDQVLDLCVKEAETVKKGI